MKERRHHNGRNQAIITNSKYSKNHKVFLSRKKMKSIKDETDQLYGIIHKFENATTEAEQIAKEV